MAEQVLVIVRVAASSPSWQAKECKVSLTIDNAINILLIHGELRTRCWDGGERTVGAG